MEYSVQSFQLTEGDTLILMSDGIPEAQDSQGRLYGFDRVDQLLKKPAITAEEIAMAAQKFGQEDDILVLRIQRDMQPVLAFSK
jgi:serine phosphatase RsbU (regulator of sigma subunit)